MNTAKKLIEYIYINLFSKGAFHIVIGSFFTKFVAFFGSIFLVRILTKADYGILSYYENLISYFLILAGGGLASGLQRYIILADTFEEKKTCYNNALHIGTIWNIVLIAVALLFFLIYPHPDAFKGYFGVAATLTACIPFIYIVNANLSTLRAMFRYKSYAVLAFMTSSLLIIMRIIGALIAGLSGTVLFRVFCEIGCAIFCYFYVYYNFFWKIQSKPLSKTFLKKRNVYSVQIMLTDGLWAIFMLNDIFLLGQLVGDQMIVADYKVAYVIPANLSILTSAIGVFIAPYFTKKEKEGDWGWIRKKFKLVLLVNIGIMALFSLLCFFLAKPLILLLYGEKYISSVPIMRILLVASFFNNGIRATIANILSAMGIQKINLFVAGGGMALQIVLNLMLIPPCGSFGVACSSAIVYLCMGITLAAVFFKLTQNRGGCKI